jgi:hypothetical protein
MGIKNEKYTLKGRVSSKAKHSLWNRQVGMNLSKQKRGKK